MKRPSFGGQRKSRTPDGLAVEVPASGTEVAAMLPDGGAPSSAAPDAVEPRPFVPGDHSNPYVGSFRWKVFQTFENPGYSNMAKVISLVVMLTILVSTLTFILESEACNVTSFLPGYPTLGAFQVIEIIAVSIFSM